MNPSTPIPQANIVFSKERQLDYEPVVNSITSRRGTTRGCPDVGTADGPDRHKACRYISACGSAAVDDTRAKMYTVWGQEATLEQIEYEMKS
jgi:hypothetical protein